MSLSSFLCVLMKWNTSKLQTWNVLVMMIIRVYGTVNSTYYCGNLTVVMFFLVVIDINITVYTITFWITYIMMYLLNHSCIFSFASSCLVTVFVLTTRRRFYNLKIKSPGELVQVTLVTSLVLEIIKKKKQIH